MDVLRILGMEFYGYHGVFEGEKELGQRFEVDVELYLDLKPAGSTDDLELTVNYGDVYTVIKQKAEEEEFNLIETLAEEIAKVVLEKFSVKEILVRVRKPHAGLGGLLQGAEVEIIRNI